MIAVITGDIVNSRALPSEWMEKLKDALSALPKNNKWEIFRGDSFQIELSSAQALITAIYIKACIKTVKGADVRMGIGLGKKEKATSMKVTEANGEAYINSGEGFDTLKSSKVNLVIKSPSAAFDDDMNLYLKLALIAMDSWSPIASEVVKQTIENQNENQDKIAKISGRSQSSISEALKRAHFSEIMELESKFRKLIVSTF